MRVLITGANGQLGRALQQTAPVEYLALSRAELDVTDFAAVWSRVSDYHPDLIIHSGALTDVDGCERDPNAAFKANGVGTQNIASVASESGASVVYLSTNFVFDGTKDTAYHEFDRPNPISVYGASKLAGEKAVESTCPRHYVVRTAMVYDESARNFVNTMLRLANQHDSLRVVADQYGNPTYARDLAEAVWKLVERPSFGTYHLTNMGTASWHDWAVEIFKLAGKQLLVEPIAAADYQRPATPPRNGVLANLSAQALGITLPHWRDALARCLTNRAKSPATE